MFWVISQRFWFVRKILRKILENLEIWKMVFLGFPKEILHKIIVKRKNYRQGKFRFLV